MARNEEGVRGKLWWVEGMEERKGGDVVSKNTKGVWRKMLCLYAKKGSRVLRTILVPPHTHTPAKFSPTHKYTDVGEAAQSAQDKRASKTLKPDPVVLGRDQARERERLRVPRSAHNS